VVTPDVVDAVRRLVTDERLGAKLTVVAGTELGSTSVFDREAGVVAGVDPGAAVTADAAALVDREKSATLRYDDGVEVFVDVMAPRPRLLVFGAVHIAQELSAIAVASGITSRSRTPARPSRRASGSRMSTGSWWAGPVISPATSSSIAGPTSSSSVTTLASRIRCGR